MAATQSGTGSLTVAGQAVAGAVFVTIPSGTIVESVTQNPGGSPDFEDVMDEDGAFHTRITFEKRMNGATVVLVGKAYTKSAGDLDGTNSNYYVESVSAEKAKGAIRTTITVTRLPTISVVT
jgi:hypothetical protein